MTSQRRSQDPQYLKFFIEKFNPIPSGLQPRLENEKTCPINKIDNCVKVMEARMHVPKVPILEKKQTLLVICMV